MTSNERLWETIRILEEDGWLDLTDGGYRRALKSFISTVEKSRDMWETVKKQPWRKLYPEELTPLERFRDLDDRISKLEKECQNLVEVITRPKDFYG